MVYVIQRTRIRLGDRSFALAEPRLWNSLPVGLRHLNLSIGQCAKDAFVWVGHGAPIEFFARRSFTIG